MPMTITQTRDFINTWIRNDARLSFTDLRLNTALISLLDNIELLVIGAGGEPTIAPGTTAQYWRGDKTWQTLNKTAVGLSNVQNVDQTNATNLTSGTIDAARYGALTIPVGAINATGTPGATTVLYGNGTWGTPTIPDGDYGGITIGGSGTTMTINDGVVTYAMLQDIPEDRVLGRVLPGTGPVTALTGSDITPLLDLFTSTTAGIVPLSGGGTTNFLRADGTWAAPAGSGGIADGDYGDITATSGGTVLTVDNSAITLAKMANIATARFIGRITAGTGVPEALTGTEATSLLDVFSTTAKGLVPVASGGSETTQFLRKDGTWAVPAGGGGSGTVNSGTQYRIAYYATAGTAVSEAAAITAARALISDANGVPTHSSVTSTELGYVSGVTSAIQTQLNAKQATLVSGTNIKTVNSVSLLGSGNIVTPNFANTNLEFTANRTHYLADYHLYLDRSDSVDYPSSSIEFAENFNNFSTTHSGGNYSNIYMDAYSDDASTNVYLEAHGSGIASIALKGSGIAEIDGDVKLLNYTSAVTGGAAVYSLNVDSTGKIITGAVGGGGSYTDEQAQDAVGAMVSGEFTYTDATPLLEINAINWSKITGEPTTLAGYGITDGIDAVLAINKITNDFIDWQDASDASGSGVYSQKITPSNYNTAYTSHGRASLYTTGWMRFNGVNASGRPNVVRSDGYNVNMGGSRILTDEAGFRTALESHFEQGADDLFEWFHEVTTYSGGTERPLGLYTNKTTGATAVNFLATASVSFQTVAGVNLFGFNSTGNYAFEGTGGTLTLYNGTTADEAYQLQVDNTTVYHNSFGLTQQFDARVNIVGHASGVFAEIADAYNGNGSPIYISLSAASAVTKNVLHAVGPVNGWMGVTLQNTNDAGFTGIRFLNEDGAGMRMRGDQYGRLYWQQESGSDKMGLTNIGEFFLYSPTNATKSNVLYYDSSTGEVTYGATPSGGGGDMLTTATNTMSSAGKIIFPTLSDNSNLRVGAFEWQSRGTNENYWFGNAYFDGTDYRLRANGAASLFYFGTGSVGFYNAPSGTAGDAATMTERFSISSAGVVKMPSLASATTANVVYFDSSNGTLTYGAAPSGGTTETASNGLTKVTNDIQLGGTLSAATNIDGSGTNYKLTLTNTRFQTDKGTNTAAANDLTLPADGNMFTITGNTQINALTSTNWQAGSEVTLIFTGTPTVKHNTAGGAGTAVLLLSGGVDYTAAADDVMQLVYDGTSWHETYRKIATNGGRYTFSNGLTLSSGTQVKLGGTLTASTTIATGSNALVVSTSTAAASPFQVSSTTGTGVTINTTSGTGLQATTTGSNYGLKASIHNANTNGIIGGIQIVRSTTGTAAAGLGTSFDFNLQASDGSTPTASQIISRVVTATVGSFTGELAFFTNHSTSGAERMRLNGEGLTIFNAASAPTASATNGIILYSEDVAASAELKVRDEAGNITTISPHNFSKIPAGPSEEMAWAYYSEKDGKYVNVDMLKLARVLEEVSGVKLVYTGKK